jgi:hypothetical protein
VIHLFPNSTTKPSGLRTRNASGHGTARPRTSHSPNGQLAICNGLHACNVDATLCKVLCDKRYASCIKCTVQHKFTLDSTLKEAQQKLQHWWTGGRKTCSSENLDESIAGEEPSLLILPGLLQGGHALPAGLLPNP